MNQQPNLPTAGGSVSDTQATDKTLRSYRKLIEVLFIIVQISSTIPLFFVEIPPVEFRRATKFYHKKSSRYITS